MESTNDFFQHSRFATGDQKGKEEVDTLLSEALNKCASPVYDASMEIFIQGKSSGRLSGSYHNLQVLDFLVYAKTVARK